MRIYYWKKIEGQIYEDACQNTIRNIVTNALTSKQLERIPKAHLLCCRINHKDRLFFRIIKDKLLLLAVSPHNYKTEHFIDPKVLEAALEKNVPLLEQGLVEASDFVEMQLPYPKEETSDEVIKPEFNAVYLQGSCYYVLDEAQQAVFAIGNNGVIVGDPGTGKSLMAFASMKNALEKIAAEKQVAEEAYSTLPIGYAVKSSVLLKLQYKEWCKDHETDDNVLFLPVLDLLSKCLNQPLNTDTLVNENYFNTWFHEKYLPVISKLQKSIPKSNSLPDAITNDLGRVYQELCLLAGYLPENLNNKHEKEEAYRQYRGLGKQETLFHQQGDWFIKTYSHYCQYLEDTKKIDLNLVNFSIDKPSLAVKTPFRFLVIDELQDLSPRLYRLLGNLSEMTLACYGRHQNHTNTLPFFEFLKNKLHCQIQVLPYIYRSPANVFKLMEAYMTLKKERLGQQSKIEYDPPKLALSQQNHPGTLLFLKTEAELTEFMQQHAQSTDCCIITDKDFLPYARQFTPLAFNIALINGAQFRIVVLLDLFDLPVYRKLTQESTEGAVEAMNSLIAAVGRSTECLVIAQTKPLHPHLVDAFIKPLMQIITTQNATSAITSAPASKTEWLEKAQEMEERAFKEQADAIRQRFAPPAAKVITVSSETVAKSRLAELNNNDKKNIQNAQNKRSVNAIKSLFASPNALVIWFRPIPDKKIASGYYLLDRLSNHFSKLDLSDSSLIDAIENLIRTALKTPCEEGDKIPPLYFLASCDLLLDRLFALLQKEPALCGSINPQELFFDRNSLRKNAKASKKKTVLDALRDDRVNGRSFLRYLVEQNAAAKKALQDYAINQANLAEKGTGSSLECIDSVAKTIMGDIDYNLFNTVLIEPQKSAKALTTLINNPDANYLLFDYLVGQARKNKPPLYVSLIIHLCLTPAYENIMSEILKDEKNYNRLKTLIINFALKPSTPQTQQKASLLLAQIATEQKIIGDILVDCLQENPLFAAQIKLESFFSLVNSNNLSLMEAPEQKNVPFLQIFAVNWRLPAKLRELYKQDCDKYITPELLNQTTWNGNIPNVMTFTLGTHFWLPFLEEKAKEPAWISKLDITFRQGSLDLLKGLLSPPPRIFEDGFKEDESAMLAGLKIFMLLLEHHQGLANKITISYLQENLNFPGFSKGSILQRLDKIGDLDKTGELRKRAFTLILDKNPHLITTLQDTNILMNLPKLSRVFKEYAEKPRVSHLSCFTPKDNAKDNVEVLPRNNSCK